MAKKYRVTTGCKNCGTAYETRAKKSRSAPNSCKYCGSTKTSAIKAKRVQ